MANKSWVERHFWGAAQTFIALCGWGYTIWARSHPYSTHDSAPAVVPVPGATMTRLPLPLTIILILLFVAFIVPNVLKMIRKWREPDEAEKPPALTDIQIKAIKLARQLRTLAEKGQQGCSESDFDIMRVEYEHTFAPQVKALMSEIELGGGGDSTLRRFADFALNGNDILSVASALIRQAFLQDGIDVTWRYPLL